MSSANTLPSPCPICRYEPAQGAYACPHGYARNPAQAIVAWVQAQSGRETPMLDRLVGASRSTNALQQSSAAFSDELARIDQVKECLYEMITAAPKTCKTLTCRSCRPFCQRWPILKCSGSADHSNPISLARCAITLDVGEVPHLTIAHSRWEELAERFTSEADRKALLLAWTLIQKHFDHGLDLADSAACLSELTRPHVGVPLMQQPSRARVALNSAASIAPSCYICSMCKAAECNHDTATIGIANAVRHWARKASNLNNDSDKQIKQCLERLSNHVTRNGSDAGWLGGIRQAKIELGIADPGTDGQATASVTLLPRDTPRQKATAATSAAGPANPSAPPPPAAGFCFECCHMDDMYRCSGTAAHVNPSDLVDLALQRSSHAGPEIYRQAQAYLGRFSTFLGPGTELRGLVSDAQELLRVASVEAQSAAVIRKAQAALLPDHRMAIVSSDAPIQQLQPAPDGSAVDPAFAGQLYVAPRVGGSYNDYIWLDPGQSSIPFPDARAAQHMQSGVPANVVGFPMLAAPNTAGIDSFASITNQQQISWGLGTGPLELVHYGMDQGYGTLQESGGVPHASVSHIDDTTPQPFSAYALPQQGVMQGQTHHQQQLLTGYSTQHPSQAVADWDGFSPIIAGAAPPPMHAQAGLEPGYGGAPGNFDAGQRPPVFDQSAYTPHTTGSAGPWQHALPPSNVQPGAGFDMSPSGGASGQYGEECGWGDPDDQRGQFRWQ